MAKRLAHVGQKYPEDSFLGGLSDAAYMALDRRWTVNEYRKGQIVMNSEETHTDVFFLLTGAVRVALFTEAGREVSMLTLRKGDVFGEFSAIDGAPRSASIEALDTCITARLSAEEFRDTLRATPDLSLRMLELLVGKLRGLTSKVSDFNALNADQRIRAELLRLAQAAAAGHDSFVIERPPTQAEIAARVFSNRETVAREMGRLKAAGLLARQGRGLHVPSLRALERELDPAAD